MTDLRISPKKIALALFACVLLLTAASLIGQYYKPSAAGDQFWLKVINKLDLDLEKNNLPTWYQSATLLLSCFLLAVIALVNQAKRNTDFRYWAVLSVIFLYLSMDEAVAIHEQLTLPLRRMFDFRGFFYLSWVVPAGLMLLLLFVFYLRFLFRLPVRTRNLLIGSGTIYVLGAIGMEMLGARYLDITNDLPTVVMDFRYVLMTTLEEFLEMTGIALFIFTLLDYLTTMKTDAETIEPEPAAAVGLNN